jgi:myo-inositol-1-phosphate synthase
MEHGLKGALVAPSSYFMKSPPQQFPDHIAREMVEDFIRRYGHRPAARGRTAARVRRAARRK